MPQQAGSQGLGSVRGAGLSQGEEQRLQEGRDLGLGLPRGWDVGC